MPVWKNSIHCSAVICVRVRRHTCRISGCRSLSSGPQRWDRWWAESRCQTQSLGCRTRGTRSLQTPRRDTGWQWKKTGFILQTTDDIFRFCTHRPEIPSSFLFSDNWSPWNDEKWCSQKAEAKIADSQVDGHELWRFELLPFSAENQQHGAVSQHRQDTCSGRKHKAAKLIEHQHWGNTPRNTSHVRSYGASRWLWMDLPLIVQTSLFPLNPLMLLLGEQCAHVLLCRFVA